MKCRSCGGSGRHLSEYATVSDTCPSCHGTGQGATKPKAPMQGDEIENCPAAFINAIAEEGTKAEAVEWLQKTWNELCAARQALTAAEARGYERGIEDAAKFGKREALYQGATEEKATIIAAAIRSLRNKE